MFGLIFVILPLSSVGFRSSLANQYHELNVISIPINNILPKKLNHSPFTQSISHSFDISFDECQSKFKWDRWNCPRNDFIQKRSENIKIDRETAFVQAISVAALLYTITKNCSRGEFNGCGCIYHKIKENDVNWKFHAECSDNIEFGEKITNNEILNYIEIPRLSDVQGYAEYHNNRAGKIAVRNSLKKNCRCHGLSGSCSLQTCWLAMDAFPQIATNIRKMYDQSVQLKLDNYGGIEKDNINEEMLVYVNESPNYCQKNIIPNWNGMLGRQCSRSRSENATVYERKSCKNLCRACGLRVRKRKEIEKVRCNCRFVGCCNVACDVCTNNIDVFYCE